MLRIESCLSATYDLVFMGKFYPLENNTNVPVLCNELPEGAKQVVIKIIEADHANNELEIIKHIKNNQLKINIPEIFHVSKLDEKSLEDYIEQSPVFEEYYESLGYNFDNSTVIIFEYIEGTSLTKDRAISNLDILISFIDSLHRISIVHGDIHINNLIDTGSEIYLIDFGRSFDCNWDSTKKWLPYEATIEDGLDDLEYEFVVEKTVDWYSLLKMYYSLIFGKHLSLFEITTKYGLDLTREDCISIIRNFITDQSQ